MTDEVKNAQAGELNPTPALSEAVAEVKAKEETIGEVLKSQKQESKDESVPLASFYKLRKKTKLLLKKFKNSKRELKKARQKKKSPPTSKPSPRNTTLMPSSYRTLLKLCGKKPSRTWMRKYRLSLNLSKKRRKLKNLIKLSTSIIPRPWSKCPSSKRLLIKT